jgi:hypothetical protein
MENKFYTDNFEQLLRETTDQFRMYPSKRVWHSIYNDLHPSKKWPSLAVLMLLITSIMYIGVSNSNETLTQPANVAARLNKNTSIPVLAAKTTNMSSYVIQPSNAVNNTNTSSATSSATIPSPAESDRRRISSSSQLRSYIGMEEQEYIGSIANNSGNSGLTFLEADHFNMLSGTIASRPASQDAIAKDELQVTSPEAEKEQQDQAEKAWIEDFVFHNKKNTNKFRDKIVYQFYTTPSVGFRSLSNSEFSPPPARLIANGQANTIDNSLYHTSALNMEAGGNILYNFSRNLRLKAGLQINYTNYKINAYELNHPTSATVNVSDVNNGLESYNTILANTPGLYSKNLNSNTYQLSVPLGADIKIAGNNKLKWYAGATVQPTYIAGGNAYLISSDLKNYVADDGMMRKFNLNGGIETFLSYKTRNGIILNAGPQFRYQFLSTYVSEYSFDEKLYNIGLKLGITTNF